MSLKKLSYLVITLTILLAAAADASIIGGLTHQKKAGQGEKYTGSILIKNEHKKTEEIKFYQTDYAFNYKGVNYYGQPGKLKRSNAQWITFTPHKLTIPPGETVKLNYTVNVPDDPNLEGTYWSMIMAENIPHGSPESTLPAKDKTKLGIVQVVRYGLQMVTHINDTGTRKIDFLDTKLLKDSSERILQVDVENTGQRWLRPTLWTELYDESGSYLGRFEAGKRRLFPDTSVRYEVDLTNLPEGNYKALVVADAGGDYIFGANYNFKFIK